MKLTVSSKNEYYYYPEILDNLEKEEKDRFAIVVKKVNQALSGGDWFKYDTKGKYLGISNSKKLRSYVKGLKNAPMLDIDGKTEREVTIDDLFSDDFPALYQIVTGLNDFVLKLDTDGEIETKKS